MPRKKAETPAPPVVLPKTYTLTEEQFNVIKDGAIDLMDIRRTLANLEGNESISEIMFSVGRCYYLADRLETQLDELRDSFEDDCEDCDDNF